MHEVGLRILIRKCQLIAGQYERALTPIVSYSKDHYMRAFLRCEKGKKKVDDIIKQHGMLGTGGPLWLGRLQDEKFLYSMKRDAFMDVVYEESKEPFNSIPGFFDLHAMAKKLKISVPKTETMMKGIKKRGYKVTRTHFSKYGLKTDMPEEEFYTILSMS